MPSRRVLCSEPGCSSVTRSGRCTRCAAKARARQKQYDKKRGSAWSRGYDDDWTELRNKYIRLHPFCVKCGARAEEVDHIIPIRRGGRRLDPQNLQSLCGRCHRKKTANER